MQDQYSRTQLLLGAEAMTKLHNSRVAVFGVGGVGGYTVEALARSGVGALDLIDDDKVCLTNLNRQIIATRKTVGQYKVDVAEERVHDIDPNIKVTTYKTFFGPETQDSFDFTQFDYVVDAIDTVTGKLALVMKCKEAGVPIICSMGAPVYVCAKDMQANTVTVGPESELFDTIVYANEVNWIAIPELKGPLRVTARTRYHQTEQPATVYPAGPDSFRLEFDQPQRAPTPGQAVVLYQGDVVLGGGTIMRVEK